MMKVSMGGRSLAEPLILNLSGFALLFAGTTDVYSLFHFGGTGSASLTLAVVSYQYGILICLIGAASFMMRSTGRTITETGNFIFEVKAITSRILASVRSVVPTPHLKITSAALYIVAPVAIGAALRMWFIDQPMRYDEAFTFNVFIMSGRSSIFYYLLPNNHVLYSILEYLSCLVLGTGPVAIRMPALLFGIGLIPLVSNICKKLNHGRSTCIASCGVAVCPYLVLYSTNGRGYTLLAFVVALLVRVGLDASGSAAIRRTTLMSFIAALGMLVMPSMLYALGGILCWLSTLLYIEKRNWKLVLFDLIVPCVACTTLLTLLFYLPVALASGGLQRVMSNRFVDPLPADQFVQAVFPHFLSVIDSFSRYFGLPLIIAISALAVIGIIGGMRNRHYSQALLLPCLAAGSFLVFVLKRSIPFDRTWIYFIPIVLVTAEAGVAWIIERWSRLSYQSIFLAVVCVSTSYAIWLAVTNAVEKFPDTGYAPQAEAASKYLNSVISIADTVCAELPADAPIEYYLWRGVKASRGSSEPTENHEFFVRSIRSNTSSAWSEQGLKEPRVFGDLAVYAGQNTKWLQGDRKWNCSQPRRRGFGERI